MLLSETLESIELREGLLVWDEFRVLAEDNGIEKKTLQVLRKFKLFDLVRQEWAHHSGGPIQLDVYLTKNGDHIDAKHKRHRPAIVRAIEDRGIQAEKSDPDHCVCTIGKGKDGKWWGWSHRAMVGFGPGDRIFDEKYGDDDTPYVKHGKRVIVTDADAKQAAISFARSVS